MAIVQISRITQRKGLEVDLPQPLASAELGWALDQRRLFIGNGTLDEGAPVVGNTEILTEFSDVLNFSNQYIYKGEAAGYTVQTGPTAGNPVAQSLQRRLDSYAVISDFGATGDGITDVHQNINQAFYEIYCREVNPLVRRSIFFPAGIYDITDTLNLPTYATLYGEGADNTIIRFNVQTWTNTVTWAQGMLVYNSGDSTYYRSNFDVPVGTGIAQNNPNGDPYWTAESLPQYILRTADSLQQTGVNIGTNGAENPGSIEISGIKFVTNQVHDGVLIENAEKCFFDAVTIQGVLTTADLNTATDDIAAVRWASTVSNPSQKVTFNNCDFCNWTYGTDTNIQIKSVTFSNCSFDTLYQGVVLGGAVVVNGGPQGIRLVQCQFDSIYVQGVVIDGVSLNATAYNVFYDVGNHFLGTATPFSSIISIDAVNNVSVGDMFARTTAQSVTYPRIDLNSSSSIALGMNSTDIEFYQNNVADATIATQFDLGNYHRTAGIEDVIAATSTATLVVIDADTLQIPAFKFDYTITRNGYYRTGTMTVVGCQDGTAGTGFNYIDEYIDNGATDVTLTAAHNLNVTTPKVTISYTSVGAGAGTIHYSIARL